MRNQNHQEKPQAEQYATAYAHLMAQPAENQVCLCGSVSGTLQLETGLSKLIGKVPNAPIKEASNRNSHEQGPAVVSESAVSEVEAAGS